MKILKYMQMATIVATLGFVSCNNDDIPQIDNGELKIIATIGDDKTRVNTEEDGSKFLPGDSLKIHYGSSSSDLTYYVTKNGTVNGIAEFQPTNKKIVFIEPNSVFGAEYSTRNIGGGNWYGSSYYATLTTQGGVTDQSTVEKLRKFDIMFGIYNANYFETSVVSFNMKHMLSKVTVTIKEYNGFDNPGKDSYKINNMTIYNKLPGDWVTFDGNEYNWSYSDSDKISEILPLMKEDKTNGKHSFTAIIKPRAYSEGDVFISFEFQGVEYKVLANSDLCRDGFLESGKHYHFDLTINKKASVKMSNVTLIDWEEEEFTEFTR